MVALRQRDDSHLSHLLHQVVPRLPPHAQPTPQQLLMLGGLTKGGRLRLLPADICLVSQALTLLPAALHHPHP